MAGEQHAGAFVEPVQLEAGYLVPTSRARAVDDALRRVLVRLGVPGAVLARFALPAEAFLAEFAHSSTGEYATGRTVEIHDAIRLVDDIRMALRRGAFSSAARHRISCLKLFDPL